MFDEGRSKLRQVSRLADSRELTNFSMQMAARLSNWSAVQSRVFFAQAIHCGIYSTDTQSGPHVETIHLVFVKKDHAVGKRALAIAVSGHGTWNLAHFRSK